jgi:hypothetical protein
MNIDEQIAAEIDELVDISFKSSDFWWRNYISWVERGMPSLPAADYAALRDPNAPEAEQIVRDIPIIGTIDSATGAITHTAPLPEPPAPPPAEYAAGRMSFASWIIGALGIAAAVAIAAAVVLVERVRGGRS